MMQSPLVSIVIPTYKPDFLGQAIESALAQTHPSIEMVVSDQCPDEGVRDLVSRFPDIRYLRNPVPGVYSNFRNCIRQARGEFVKFLLDDDLLEPNCIERLAWAFRRYKGTTLACGWYRVVDERNKELELRKLPSDDDVVSSPGGAAAYMLMSGRNPIGPLTTSMFRRRSFPLGLGPWFFQGEAPERYLGLMDMAIILDLAFSGRVVTLAEPLSSMRKHSLQLSNPSTNPRVVRSITSWLPYADDAYAYGLISEQQHRKALKSILAQFGRFRRMLPSLEDDIERLEERLIKLNSERPEAQAADMRE